MNRIFKVIIIIAIIISFFSTVVFAGRDEDESTIDTSRKASLTIELSEYSNGSEEAKPLKGVEFTIYKVRDNEQNITEAEEYIENSQGIDQFTGTTNEEGTTKFENLELGRYLVVETNSPKNVTKKVDSFFIDLPTTKENGQGWEYDVTVYPKVETIYGKITLIHEAIDGTKLPGAKWKLEELNNEGKWVPYIENGSQITATTNNEGTFSIENLEVGIYRIIQVQETEGYIFYERNMFDFEIHETNLNFNFVALTSTPKIEQTVARNDKIYQKELGCFVEDNIFWSTNIELPNNMDEIEVFKITENIDSNLIYSEDSLKIYGIDRDGNSTLLTNRRYDYSIEDNKIIIQMHSYDIAALYEKLNINFETTFNSETSKEGEFNVTADLVYTNHASPSGESKSTDKKEATATVYMASLLIKKTDEKGNPLSGAIFKIAESKQDLKEKRFISNGLTDEFASDENGYVIFTGLKIGQGNESYDEAQPTTYYAIEVQAPSYIENGETKYYNLLKQPIEVVATSTSGNYVKGKTTEVVNKKGFILPLTGGYLNIVSIVLGVSLIGIGVIIKRKNEKKEEECRVKEEE